MQALVYTAPGVMELHERPVPQPAADEIRIRVKTNGICGSDVQGYLGKTGRRIPPLVMGHEFSGIVDTIGSAVQNWRPGDRVLAYPALYCGCCSDCRNGQMHRCRDKSFLGAMSRDGAMTTYLCLPQHLIIPVPPTLTDDTAALTEPLAVAWRAIGRAGDLSGRKVLIVGAGTIGLLVLQAIRLKNPVQVWISDINPDRLRLAEQLGADATLNPDHQDLAAFIAAQTSGRGVDVAVEAVGLAATVSQAVDALRPGGICVWIGNHQQIITCDMQKVVTRELTLCGSYIYSPDEFRTAADLLAAGKVLAEPLISDHLGLSEGSAAFRMLAEQPEKHLKVILHDDATT